MKKIYLDWNSYGITSPLVLECLAKDGFANPSSKHSLGQRNRARLMELNKMLSAKLGIDPEMNISYVSSATEANFTVLNNYEKVYVSDVEHPSVRECPNAEIIPVDENGQIKLDVLEDRIRHNTKPFLVSYMLANHETGIINNINPVAALTKKYGGYFHTDAVQACGRIDLSSHLSCVDYVTIASYKAGGMIGVAALVHRYPLKFGWTYKRNGTVPIQLIEGLIIAMDLLRPSNHVLESLLDPGIQIIGKSKSRLPNTTCIRCKDKMKLLMALDFKGICISSGAACASGTADQSHSITAMGYDFDTVRISSGWSTTQGELEECAKWLNQYAL